MDQWNQFVFLADPCLGISWDSFNQKCKDFPPTLRKKTCICRKLHSSKEMWANQRLELSETLEIWIKRASLYIIRHSSSISSHVSVLWRIASVALLLFNLSTSGLFLSQQIFLSFLPDQLSFLFSALLDFCRTFSLRTCVHLSLLLAKMQVWGVNSWWVAYRYLPLYSKKQ